MSFVVDSSVCIAWCIPEERTPQVSELLQQALTQALFVPSIWPLEIANVLGQANKADRLSLGGVQAAFSLLLQLDLRIQPAWTLEQAQQGYLAMRYYGLTAYDVGYLQLALQMSLPLATLDRKLAAAAQAANIPLL